MSEKSLEEIMTDLSSEVTTASTTDEPIVIDLSNVHADNVTIASQSPVTDTLEHIKNEAVKEEVKEMIENVTFFNQHIDKDMNVLEKEFVKMERAAADVDDEIEEYKRVHKEVFDGLEKLEKKKAEILEPKEDWREVICSKMNRIGEKKWKGLEVEFTYVASTTKKKFDTKKFEAEQPLMYKKYTIDSPVKAYIKTNLRLLPKELREQADNNAN